MDIILPEPDWERLKRLAQTDPKHAFCDTPGSSCEYVSTHRGRHIFKASGPGPFQFGVSMVQSRCAGTELFYSGGRWFNSAWSAICTIDEELSP